MSSCSVLQNIPFFAGFSEKDLHDLSEHLTRRRFTKAQTVFCKGDEGDSLYIILRGRVKVVLPSPHGEEVILAILSDNEIIGELSFIDGGSRSATVTTLGESELLCLRRKDFLDFLSNRFDAVQRVLETLTQRLRDTDILLEEAYFLDITSRVARKIVSLGKQFGILEKDGIRIGVRVTQTDLASMIGSTRETVNKQLKLFRETGLISLDKGTLTITDPTRLARRARISMASFT